jgi:hypothetical protein
MQMMKRLPVMYRFAVIQMLHLAICHDLHNVTDLSVGQMKFFGSTVIENAHALLSFAKFFML